MDKAVIYIHGKGGDAEEALHYKSLFSDCDVIGLDYTAQFPWEAKEEFPLLFNSIYRMNQDEVVREVMQYMIREMKSQEYRLLSDFLYEAIYIPEGVEAPPRSVIDFPELQEYIIEFGNRKHDKALVAEIQGDIVGAIWVRIMNDYGHIDNDTPSLAMSVCPRYRGLGIGTSLLKQLLQVERLAGYSKISLSVQKSNYAVKMYEKVGFTVVDENDEEYIMIVNL